MIFVQFTRMPAADRKLTPAKSIHDENNDVYCQTARILTSVYHYSTSVFMRGSFLCINDIKKITVNINRFSM